MEHFKPQRHHKQLCFCRGDLADACQTFLAIALPKALPSQAVAYFQFVGTQIAHKTKRAETAADVASKVDDEPLNALIFEIADDVIQTSCEIQANGTGACRHSDIANMLVPNLIGEAF